MCLWQGRFGAPALAEGYNSGMRNTRARSSWQMICVLLGLVASADPALGAPASNILEKKLASPSPIQWKSGDVEISLIGVAWGPADSPEMVSKGRDQTSVEKPEFYPDRTYALALGFRAQLATVVSGEMYTSSGLAQIKNVGGDIEVPVQLTHSGFVPFSGSPGVYDVHFNRSSTTEYWDLFPVSPDQKEFLFEVFSGSDRVHLKGTPNFSFRIVRKGADFVLINASPGVETCLNFRKSFAGTVGTGSRVKLQLRRENATVSGTEQYLRIGKTLWLQGTADSLGNLVVEERYPKDRVTGIFKGKFSQDCQTIAGFFSKPDGTRLQPFEFREVSGTSPPDANGSDTPQQ